MRVIVRTFNMESGAEVRSRSINWAKPEMREWFTRALSWALHNGCGVQVCNVEDEFTEESSQNGKRANA